MFSAAAIHFPCLMNWKKLLVKIRRSFWRFMRIKKENQECWINVRLVQTYKGQPASEDRLSFASVI